MKLRITHVAPAALVALALASGCATTTESKRPVATSTSMAMPSQPAAGEASTTDLAALPLPDAATRPNAPALPVEALDAPTAEAAGAIIDPQALSAQAAEAERAAERKLSAADYRYQLARANLVLKKSPKNGRALFERAKANSNLKNYREAKLDYVAALRTMRGNPDVYYNKAVNELMLHEYKPAANDFSGTVRLRPDDKEAFFGRGVAKMQMYQFKMAVSDFTRAIAIDSMYADALEYRGISYANFDRTKEARKDLERAVKINPEAKKSLRRYCTSLAQK